MEKVTFSTAEIFETIESTVSDGGYFPLVVSGTSMNPFLQDGRDIVWLRACDQADLKRGAILLFKRNDSGLVLHRVREVLPDGELLMNGDAQTWCEKIKTKQVVAVVSDVEKNGKKKSCSSYAHKAKSVIWHMTMPVRPYIMRVWRKFK